MSKIFFIGAGKMATAIAGGLCKSGTFAPGELEAFDISPEAAQRFTAATGIHCGHTAINEAELERAEAVLLAVKPQYLADALTGIKCILESKLIISIAAGISLERLYDMTDSYRIVRVMPNTPALIGCGCAVAAMTKEVSTQERDFVAEIFRAIGSYAVVEEKQLDAVTGLSGSGPAFVFAFIQALADGGVAEGLPRDLALQLAAQTVAGAARMVTETQTHPAVLSDQVCSPAGTTIRGVEALHQGGLHKTVMNAVRSAAERSRELGKN
ncbi:MAG: pyrroline-5-carboxylate reductase [Lentisphaeria bacterium]|nr:pyrroline-5-carboxylate reductase [Lentisphaeria bacterium]